MYNNNYYPGVQPINSMYKELAVSLGRRLTPANYTFERERKIENAIPNYLTKLKANIEKTKSNVLPQSILVPVKADFFMQLIQWHITYMDEVERLALTGAIIGMNHMQGKLEICGKLADSFAKPEGLKYAAALSDCSHLTFALAVGKVLGVSPEYCFHTFPERSGDPNNAYIYFKTLFSPFESNKEVFNLTGAINQKSYDGRTIQTVYRYSSASGENIFPITSCQNGLSERKTIGIAAPANTLFNMPAIENNPHASILLVPNPNQLFSLLEYSEESRMPERCSVEVTEIFGGTESLKGLNYHPFFSRKVTVLCSPDCKEYEMMNKIVDACIKNGAKEVRIVPCPVISEHCHFSGKNISRNLAKELDQNVIDISSFERVKFFVDRIESMSLSINEWEKWEMKHHLREGSDKTDDAGVPMFTSLAWDYGLYETKDNDYSLDSMFSASSISMLYGPTGCCKSTLALELSLAASGGFPFMGMQVVSNGRVVYADGELRGQISRVISNLMANKTPEIRSEIHHNLSIIKPDEAKNIAKNQDKFLSYIEMIKPRLVVFDNLIKLLPDAINPQNSEWSRFTDKLIDLGVHPLLIHHTAKDDKRIYLGSSRLGALTQNIFRVECLTLEDLHTVKMELPDDVQRMFDKGRFIQVTLEKTKVAPLWEGKSIIMYRAIDGAWMQLTHWPDVQEPVQTTVQEPALEIVDPLASPNSLLPALITADTSGLEDLSRDERKAYDFITSRPSGIKRDELDEWLGCKEAKSQRILKTLCARGFVEKLGNGNNIYYKAKLVMA